MQSQMPSSQPEPSLSGQEPISNAPITSPYPPNSTRRASDAMHDARLANLETQYQQALAYLKILVVLTATTFVLRIGPLFIDFIIRVLSLPTDTPLMHGVQSIKSGMVVLLG
jgi:hypothetical protein